MSTSCWPWPKGTVASQWFGEFPGGYNPAGGHTGIDGKIPAGTPLRAPEDGWIEHEGWFGTQDGSDNPWLLTDGGGIQVVLNCGEGKPQFHLAHMSSTVVDKGQWVKKGDLLGYSGNTGRWTTGPHAHFEALPAVYNLRTNTYGRVDPSIYCKTYWEDVVAAHSAPAGPALADFQRVTVKHSKVAYRQGPAESAELIKWLEPDHIYDFKGYVRRDGDFWLVGRYSDGFAWRGGFQSHSLDGLKDLTDVLFPAPAPAAAGNKRTAGPDGVRRRKMPDKNGELINEFAPGAELTLGGYVEGTDPYGKGNKIWFVGGISGGYMHSSAFTDSSTVGLSRLELPKDVPASTLPAYDFELDFKTVLGKTVVKAPAHRDNLEQGNFPKDPVGIVVHIMGKVGVDTLQSTTNWFQNPAAKVSAGWGVGKNGEVTQFVKMGHRAYHAAGGNDMYGIETDPEQSPATIAATRELIRLIRAKHPGKTLKLFLHYTVPGSKTACGTTMDLAKFEPVVTPAPAPAPAPAPKPTPAPAPAPKPAPAPAPAPVKPPENPFTRSNAEIAEIIREYQESQLQQFLKDRK